MNIEIKLHTGLMQVPGKGMVEASVAQDRIFIDGKPVGYVGHDPHAPICLIGNASEGVKHLIRDAVDRHKKMHMPDRKVVVPYAIGDSEEEKKPNE